MMQKHTLLGYEVLQQTTADLRDDDNMVDARRMVQIAANLAVAHHERWDGSGYPKHLKGEEIPVSARLMAVADVYDALVSPRIYKKAQSHEEAMSIIIKEKGSHFDPDVVDAFLTFADELPEMYKKFESSEQ